MKINVYIINLSRDIDRRNFIKEQFNKFNFEDYYFIEGVYGPSLTTQEKLKLYDNNTAEKVNMTLLDRQIGASLSHQKCYKKMISSNESHVIIIEDDVVFDQNFINFIKTFNSDNFLNCDFLMLGYFTSNIRKDNSKPLKYSHEIIQYTYNNLGYETVAYLKEKNKIIIGDYVFYEFDPQSYMVDFLQGGHAYLISNKAAHNLVQLNGRVVVECDNIWNFFHRDINFKLYGSVPPLVLCNYNIQSGVEKEKIQSFDTIKVSKTFLKRINRLDFGT